MTQLCNLFKGVAVNIFSAVKEPGSFYSLHLKPLTISKRVIFGLTLLSGTIYPDLSRHEIVSCG